MRTCILAAAGAVLLGGCSVLGDVAGAAASIATSLATANPVVGVSVGIGVKAAADEALRTLARRRSRTEQDAIAAAVEGMAPGESRAWQANHAVRIGTERGEVRVVRVIETPLALCKEVLFSVVREGRRGESREWFATTACRDGEKWKWAAAEPAVERWGGLQ